MSGQTTTIDEGLTHFFIKITSIYLLELVFPLVKKLVPEVKEIAQETCSDESDARRYQT